VLATNLRERGIVFERGRERWESEGKRKRWGLNLREKERDTGGEASVRRERPPESWVQSTLGREGEVGVEPEGEVGRGRERETLL
jgi:hypothetical protein